MKFKKLGFALIAGVGLFCTAALALDVDESFDVSGIRWDVNQHGGATVRITGPATFLFEQSFETGETIFFDFADMKQMANGQYNYEVVVSPFVGSDEAIEMQLAREFDYTKNLAMLQGATASGSFQIQSGQIVDRDLPETFAKDQVILDDLIVDGSLCVGFDCVNGESFGFDTIRLKENNLRIRFTDTSTSASFPSRDWQITINDTSNGGANKFSIDDIDGGRTPFTIEAGAPSHSLYVEDGGRIGFGTSTPVVDLHVKSGNTPTLRLEQDGSSGFTPQTWDVAGNEANFFVRDATSGSTLPFRVFPGAPSNSLIIAGSTGDVGVGTTTPSQDLHLKRTSGNATLLLENTNAAGAVQIRLQSDNPTNRRILARNAAGGNESQIIYGDDGSFIFAGAATPANNVMTIDSAGNVVITGNCSDATGGGGCTADYVFEPDYALMPLDELADFVAENRHLPNVPPADETRAKGLNLSAMNGRLLEKIEESTLYILAQEERIQRLEAN